MGLLVLMGSERGIPIYGTMRTAVESFSKHVYTFPTEYISRRWHWGAADYAYL